MGRNQQERLYRLRRLLAEGRCARPVELTAQFEVTRSTLNRDIGYLRDRMNFPVTWDAEREGWCLDMQNGGKLQQYELPGFWLNAQEIHSLLTLQQLLANLDEGGWLRSHVRPLMKRLTSVLQERLPATAEIGRRVRVQPINARRMDLPHFQSVALAVLQRKRILVRYHARSTDEASEREVSPQRLLHYRDSWYLDAWCHLKCALRRFSIDALQEVRVLDAACLEIPDSDLDDISEAGYGVFAGANVTWARLRFSPDRARWVAAERWHPDQHGVFDAAGRWQLDVPYADPRELIGDILRHVPDVEVLWPEHLAAEVSDRLREAVRRIDEAG